MDFKAFIEAVKIETKPITLRGQKAWVRNLSALEVKECVQLAEKWNTAREKKLGVKEMEDFTVPVESKDKPGTTVDLKVNPGQVAYLLMAKAVICLSNENGKPIFTEIKQIEELVMGEGKLQESEVREINKVLNSFEEKKETEETEKKDSGDEKN